MRVQVAVRRPWRAIAATMVALAAALAPAQFGAGAEVDEPTPGMAGIDTSLPLTESAVTIRGRGEFAAMEFTVNQTEGLTNQAISLTWEGGAPTVSASSKIFFSNFVQVMQCWGDPDDLVPENPGPPPEKCIWGALNPTAASELPGFASSLVTSRAFSNKDFPDFDPDVGTLDEGGSVFRDFIAVDGTVVTDHVDAAASGLFDQYWLNPYFNSVTSNELPGVRTLDDGRGQALFTVDTGVESNGLGCGQMIQADPAGEPEIPQCWLVIVPRGTPEVENEGIPYRPTVGVASSPMSPNAWRNRIAVPLDFQPVDSPCNIGSDQRRVNGTEMALGAVASWQPALCTQPGRLPFSYVTIGDPLARTQLTSDFQGRPGMVVVNRPLPPEASTPEDPIVYAPLVASAAVIGFNVERVPSLQTVDDGYRGVRYAEMNLTPRLVAKLLTQSYRSQVEIQNSKPYDWDDANPAQMLADPDFLQFNPEFGLWQSGALKNAGGLILPAGTADYASQLWDWVLADPEAAAWLAGEADEWGMVVNPFYTTVAEENSTGFAFGTPPPGSFPKSDPYCYEAAELGSGVVPPALCTLDWLPYSSSLAEGARLVATASDGSKTILNRFAGRVQEVWQRTPPQALGARTMFGLVDLPTTTRFGLQAARLSRAGDNGPDREFVAPDDDGLTAALASMDDGPVPQVGPVGMGDGAYPLTALSYAAVRPLSLSEAEREDFAALLAHAAGPGQEPGFEYGQLPPGYLPLPSDLRAKTAAAAQAVRTLQPEEPAPSTTTTTEPVGMTTTTTVATTATTVATTTSIASPPAAPGGAGSPVRRSSGGSPPLSSSDLGAVPPPADAPLDTTPVVDDVDDAGEEASTVPLPSGQVTPVVAIGSSRFFVALLTLLALLAALGCLEITKRPRRGTGTPTLQSDGETNP